MLLGKLEGRFCRNSKEQNVGCNAARKKQAQEVSFWRKGSTGRWTPDCVCCASEQNLSTFCSCPETLKEIEIKGNGPINLVEEQGRVMLKQQHGYCRRLLALRIKSKGPKHNNLES